MDDMDNLPEATDTLTEEVASLPVAEESANGLPEADNSLMPEPEEDNALTWVHHNLTTLLRMLKLFAHTFVDTIIFVCSTSGCLYLMNYNLTPISVTMFS
jgi:hypothetical protein